MTVEQLLDDAITVMREDGWTTGAYGVYTRRTEPTRHCIAGALRQVIANRHSHSEICHGECFHSAPYLKPEYVEAYRCVYEGMYEAFSDQVRDDDELVIDAELPDYVSAGSSIVEYMNDRYVRSFDEAVQFLEKGRAVAAERGI